jgi:hypothetical protein
VTLQRLRKQGVQHANYPPCTCPAYAFPHRPGGGVCQWPDVHADLRGTYGDGGSVLTAVVALLRGRTGEKPQAGATEALIELLPSALSDSAKRRPHATGGGSGGPG